MVQVGILSLLFCAAVVPTTEILSTEHLEKPMQYNVPFLNGLSETFLCSVLFILKFYVEKSKQQSS